MNESQKCPKCGGDGWVRMADGLPAVCSCLGIANLRERYAPLMAMIKPDAKHGPKVELKNESQGVVRNDENLGNLLYHVANMWGANAPYDLRTIEELNSIGIRGTKAYRSLADYVEAHKYFIVDWSQQNPFRGKGYVGMDESVLIDLLKSVRARPEKQAIVLIGPTAKEFRGKHRVLCETLASMGVPYFDRGKYWRFAPDAATETAEGHAAEAGGSSVAGA